MNGIPEASEFLQEHIWFLRTLARFIDNATDEARRYFRAIGRPVDPSLFPHLVRYHCKLDLLELGITAEDDEEPVELDRIANNGLSVYRAQAHFRIFKTSDGTVPPPGDSSIKQDFYQQTSFRETAGSDGRMVPVLLNMIALWEVDHDYSLQFVYFVCPRRGGFEKGSVKYYWLVKSKLIDAATKSDETKGARIRELEFYAPEGPNHAIDEDV